MSLASGGNHAEFLLPLDGRLAVGVPARVELALEPVDPLLRGMVRRVVRPGSDVQEKRLVRGDARDLAGPRDRLVGQVFGQVVVRVRALGDEVPVLEQDRVPVVHVAGVEAVEVVEPEAVGPAVERPGGARLPRGGVVVLADPGGHVAVLAEDLADGAAASRQHARVAVVAGGRLGDDPGRGGVVVAARDERGPRRAAQRRRVEPIVPQPLRRQPVQGRRRDAAAERRVLAETGVIEQDQHDVRCAFGRPALAGGTAAGRSPCRSSRPCP